MRTKAVLNFMVNDRKVTVTAFDSVGVEDCYEVGLLAALHRVKTGERLYEPVAREVKDWILRSNLFI
jgi:hypothetical protein